MQTARNRLIRSGSPPVSHLDLPGRHPMRGTANRPTINGTRGETKAMKYIMFIYQAKSFDPEGAERR